MCLLEWATRAPYLPNEKASGNSCFTRMKKVLDNLDPNNN